MDRENKLYINTNLLEYLSILGKLESLWIIVVSGLFFSIEKKWDSYDTDPLFWQLLISQTFTCICDHWKMILSNIIQNVIQ